MIKIQNELRAILQNSDFSVDERLLQVCQLLDHAFDYYNWTGFYFKNGDKNELKLGAFIGEETEHTIIPFGRGICGQVAVSGETFLVADVNNEANYLACSLKTQSEIVVPIFKNGENIGQIDIDSHTPNAFSEKDQNLLEWLCAEISNIL